MWHGYSQKTPPHFSPLLKRLPHDPEPGSPPPFLSGDIQTVRETRTGLNQQYQPTAVQKARPWGKVNRFQQIGLLTRRSISIPTGMRLRSMAILIVGHLQVRKAGYWPHAASQTWCGVHLHLGLLQPFVPREVPDSKDPKLRQFAGIRLCSLSSVGRGLCP